MPVVDIPGVGTVEFPDSMSKEQIDERIRTEILPSAAKANPDRPGLFGRLKESAESLMDKWGALGVAEGEMISTAAESFDKPLINIPESVIQKVPTDIGKGIARGAANVLSAASTPQNVVTAAALPVALAIPGVGEAAIASMAGIGAKEAAEQYGKASVAADAGDYAKAAEHYVQGGVAALMVEAPLAGGKVLPSASASETPVVIRELPPVIPRTGTVVPPPVVKPPPPSDTIALATPAPPTSSTLVPPSPAVPATPVSTPTTSTPAIPAPASVTPTPTAPAPASVTSPPPFRTHLDPDATPEERLTSAIKEPDPVSAIINQSQEGLVKMGDLLNQAIEKANAPGEGGINRAPAKPSEEPISIKPSLALKTVLRAAEKAGEAGVEHGREIGRSEMMPAINDLQDQLSESVSKAKALQMYFAGQEKGSAIGSQAMTKDLEMANRWWDSQRRDVAASLLNILRSSVPIAQRGAFGKRIVDVITKSTKLIGGDPDAMYESAAQLASEIVKRGEDIQKNNLIDSIKDSIDRSIDSPSIDAVYRERIKGLISQFETGKPLSENDLNRLSETRQWIEDQQQAGNSVVMPDEVQTELEKLSKTNLRDLSLGDLVALKSKIKSLANLGALKLRTRRAVEAAKVEELLKDMSGGESRPLETIPEFKQLMVDENMAIAFGNWWARFRTQVKVTGNALMPIDALMDLMDGAKADFMGFLHRRIRGVIDLNEQAKLRRQNELLEDFRTAAEETKLTKAQREKVGVYAEAQQPDVQNHLIETGVSKETIDSLKLNPSEMRMYNEMRKVLDILRPELQRTKYLLENDVFDYIKDYFPVQRDYQRYSNQPTPEETLDTGKTQAWDPNLIRDNLAADLAGRPRVAVRKGFTKERVGGAMPIEVNAYKIFESHVQDALHYIYQQPDLIRLAKVVGSDEFRQKYGDIGQKFVADWLNVVARNGSVDSSLRIPMLDWLRRNGNVGIVGLRLGSQLKHLSNWPFAMAHVGPDWFFWGMEKSFTAEGRKVINDLFGETQQRSGGEPAQAESESGAMGKTAFLLVREMDRLASEAAVLGGYGRELSRQGIAPENALTSTIDPEAQRLALVRARRAIPSPLAKDVPLSLSKGVGLGGNVSVARTLLQFSNVFLDRLSNLRLELYHKGFSDLANLDPRQLARFTAAFAASIGIAGGVSYGWRETKYALLGTQPKQSRTLEDDIADDALKSFIPGASQLMSAATFGQAIPALGVPVEAIQSGAKALLGKEHALFGRNLKPYEREAETVRFVGRTGAMFGVPGLSEIADATAAKVRKEKGILNALNKATK